MIDAPPRFRIAPSASIVAGIGVPALIVASVSNVSWLATLTSALAVGLACRGVGLLYGQLGLVSLCQYALLGIGGWVALRCDFAFHLPFTLSLLAGGVVASAIGVVWGLPALRVRGLYLALITLMLAGAFQITITVWGFPDGGAGFFGRAENVARVMMARPALATGDRAYFLYVAVVVILGFLLIEWHRASRPGRSWDLIRKNVRMAQASGVDLVAYQAWAFALAGFVAGIAGGLLAGASGQLDGRAFAAAESINVFALSIVGGAFSWAGALIAGLLLKAAPAVLSDLGADGTVATAIFGVLLLHALITAPAGIAGQVADLFGRGARVIRYRLGREAA